jgi:2-polyprenyl-6-hydroxyphenyl methylase/3-demethylubiquinone-9 3-methyltransferase
MTKFANYDKKEITRYDKISKTWWDPEGELGTLHAINPLRLKFILENSTSHHRVLDVGCGGGILSEALAKAGANVMGIDLSRESLEVAMRHARDNGQNIDYRHASIDDIAPNYPASFDIVTCMEMLEHAPKPARIVAACAESIKPGGHFFCSTINRTPRAFLFAVVMGEYILHLLPRGTHRYGRLIRPGELKKWAGESRLAFDRLSSFIFHPLTGKFTLAAGKEDVNYIAHFIKA